MAARVSPPIPPICHGAIPNPTYALRDDIGKAVGKHTLQFGAQYVYSQRNQTNNAIGAASGDLQGLLTYSNLTNSTGNAFADFLLQYSPDSKRVCPKLYPGLRSGPLLSTLPDCRTLFSGRLEVTSRLTLNLGLRVSLFGTYSEKNRNAWNWDASRFRSNLFSVDPVYGELLDNRRHTVPVTQLIPGDLPSRHCKRLGSGSVRP